MIIRTLGIALAAAIVTTGTVAAMADTGTSPKVTIDAKTGDYCVTTSVVTGSRIPQTQCKSVGDWGKEGVTFARR